MKILAIPASNTPDGFNRTLIGAAATELEATIDGAEIEIIDINDYEMPIYSKAREASGGVPDQAKQLFAKFGEADAIVLSYAEHNGSFCAAWKNIHDWMSRLDMGIYQGAKVVMLAATPGPRSGAGVLGAATMAAPFFGADLVGSLGIGQFPENVDLATGEITNAELRDQFTDLLGKLGAQ